MRAPDRHRRALLGAAAAFAASSLIGCRDREPVLPAGGFAGPDPARGHRLRDRTATGRDPDQRRRTDVLIVGGGIAGLAAARALSEAGVDDYRLLELEAEVGGNSRGGIVGGMACPWGAHYLPVPSAGHDDLEALLDALGLRRQRAGQAVWDERHLAHAPHERLWRPDLGRWQDGLLPVDGIDAATHAQYRRFAAAVAAESAGGRYRIPTRRAVWDAGHAALDRETFAAWLTRRGFDAAPLRWYLEYCCRDDYGAGIDQVSAWAGLHYFASRHGFHAPGDEAPDAPVLTWPQGNAWLVERLAEPHRTRISTDTMTVRIAELRHGVEVDAIDGTRHQQIRWQARRVIVATPSMVAVRLIEGPPEALRRAAATLRYAPWLVANLHLDRALDSRRDGPPLCWDNVLYGSRGLGYVNAGNQLLRGHDGPTVLTVYRAFGDDPAAGRAALLTRPWQHWANALLAELAPMHPDLAAACTEIRIARYGHAMAIPTPGVRGSDWLAALTEPTGRIAFAHADLSGHSVFEEAWEHGRRAGRQTARALRA